jgi:outer membrane protein assembly factor BamA
LNIAVSLFGDVRNSDYLLSYLYLPNRLDIGGAMYHNAYYFYSYRLGWVRDRNFGLSLFLSNPFNKYKRLSYSLGAMGINRSYLDLPDSYVDALVDARLVSPRDLYFLINTLTYTKDTTIWGYTGPVNGGRYAVSLSHSPWWWKNGIDFTTLKADWRRYLRLGKDYSFAVRYSGGISVGAHPQKFFLGGLPNWINYNYYGNIRIDKIEEIYFASFEMPLRGAEYYALEGSRFLLANFEFRFPLFRRVLMGFPLPLDLWNIGGALFTDIGVAWDEGDKLRPVYFDRGGLIQLNDRFAFASIGFGVRVFLGFFLLRTDLAWPTDFYSTARRPVVLWSIGADF